MSSSWKPCLYGPKRQELNWINLTCATHDQFCGCDNPIEHLCKIALKKEGIFGFTKENLQQLCHDFTTEDGTGDHGKDGDGEKEELPDFGDLEKLFEEDGDFAPTTSG